LLKKTERIWWTGYGNYAGFVSHGDYGPCMVWNNAVSNFVTPAYYMQKLLFSNNQGSNLMLTASPDAKNSLANPGNVSQVNNTFLAGTDFTYSFPAYSISVLRIRQ